MGYEKPKHNCSVLDVVEPAEVCTPTIVTECAPVDLAIKIVVEKEQCYDVTRTVCTESIEEITTAKTVEVSFEKQCDTQMVTVCQPAQYGYGHHHGKSPLIPDTDMPQPTTTARRLPRRLATMSPLSPLSSPRSPSLTPSQSRPVSTNPSSSPESPALTSRRTNASPSQRSRIPVSLSRSALLDLEPPPARLSSLPSPSKSARNSLTDMPKIPTLMSPPLLQPTPLNHTMDKSNC